MQLNETALKRKILSDKYNKIIFSSGKRRDIYIVGGYIRDIVLNRKSVDRDYAVKGEFDQLLNSLAFKTGGKIIRMGKKGLRRVVLRNGVTLDFSPLNKDIESDISERDFTVNSLAWSPKRGIIDIDKGREDLSRKLIRMTALKNLREDSVRILRAFRLAEELSFRIDRRTRRALRMTKGMIKQAKNERIALEFFKILNSPDPSGTLKMLLKDGVLGCLIFLNYEELKKRLKVVSKIYRIYDKLPLRYRMILNKRFSQNISYRGLFRLEVLIGGLPRNMFSLSSDIIKRITLLHRADNFLHKRRIRREMLFDLFMLTEDAAIDFLITNRMIGSLRDYERYCKIMKKGLLTSAEIMRTTGISPGPALGRLIRMIKRAEFDHKVKTKKEAIQWIIKKLPAKKR
jgi:tRNA nucleotidyltransferase (CCA-adding enzyme)